MIVHLYEEKGERCVEDLNGMFAFALWDDRERTLLLARDRIGIKPLHYCIAGGKFLFASEINSLLVSPDVDRTLSPEAIEDYFTYFYIPGRQSVYRSIRKLPPATTMTIRDGKTTQRKYWQLNYGPAAGGSPEGGKIPSLAQCADAYRQQTRAGGAATAPQRRAAGRVPERRTGLGKPALGDSGIQGQARADVHGELRESLLRRERLRPRDLGGTARRTTSSKSRPTT